VDPFTDEVDLERGILWVRPGMMAQRTGLAFAERARIKALE
jgi:hypothetical protein